jgi:hypothetical protein
MDRTKKQFKFSDRFYMPEPPQYKETISVDTKTLLSAKKREDESPFFHDITKGCEIEERTVMRKGYYKHYLKIKFCKTHEVDCHNDGWQIGFWMGGSSKFLREVPPVNKSS